MSNQQKFSGLSLQYCRTPRTAGVVDPTATSAGTPALHDFLDIFREERLGTVYQPIVDVARAGILGYEGLIRGPQDSAFATPLQLFRAATELNVDLDFELLCRRLVIRRFAELNSGHLLFLNASPALLLARDLSASRTLEQLQAAGIDPARVVIEVTEHHRTQDYPRLKAVLTDYRSHGFKVALDDVGSGHSSLRLWTELLPDYIKIDKHFIRDIHQSRLKQGFIRGLLAIAAGSNCKIIAEGIETRDEFACLSAEGVNYMQGYYFARPTADVVPAIAAELLRTDAPLPLAVALGQDNLLGITLSMTPIAASTTVREVLEMLQRNPAVNLLPIVENGLPVGLVERFVFLNELMQSLYGIELYGKMKIVDFLSQAPVQMDVLCTLEEASRIVTSASTAPQAFVVTQNGRYCGVCTVLDLLHRITEQQICSARHANPLTLLPGIVPTNDAIDRLLYSRTSFSLAYYDLDHFKPYNDHYGYDAGDRVIQKLADILRSVYRKEFSLIGHIGGDDFVVVDMSDAAEAHCREVLQRLDAAVPAFYRDEHVREGGIQGVDRQGQPCRYPLLGLSSGLVPPERTASCKSHPEISDLAAQAKRLAKQMAGTTLFVDRRSPLPQKLENIR